MVNDEAALRLNGQFSIELWAKRNSSPSTWPGILDKNGSWGHDGYLIWYGADGRMYFKRNNIEWAAPTGSLTTDRLRHFVVTLQRFEGALVRGRDVGVRGAGLVPHQPRHRTPPAPSDCTEVDKAPTLKGESLAR